MHLNKLDLIGLSPLRKFDGLIMVTVSGVTDFKKGNSAHHSLNRKMSMTSEVILRSCRTTRGKEGFISQIFNNIKS